MPRVIVKCRYYNSERSVYSAGGYLEYIGTREGVEKLGDAWKTAKATKNQIDFINAIVQKKSAITRTEEYKKETLREQSLLEKRARNYTDSENSSLAASNSSAFASAFS